MPSSENSSSNENDYNSGARSARNRVNTFENLDIPEEDQN